jgi:uncharacterized protein YkwD
VSFLGPGSRRIARSAALLAFLGGADLVSAQAKRTTAHAASAAELATALNDLRAARGVATLRSSEELTGYAQERAEVAARSGRLELDTANRQLERLSQRGYEAHLVSAVLSQAPGSAAEVLRGWLADPRGSLEEALSAEFHDLGVGVAVSSDPRQAPVYALVLGLSWADHFTAGTAGLDDRVAVRRELLTRLNHERSERRIPPLRQQPRLDRVAQDYAERMLREGFYEHHDPTGASVLERVQAIGYSFSMVGENLASGQFTAEQVFDGWLGSPEHRENLLDRDFREVGHGVAHGKGAAGWQVLWVQVFAKPR